MTEAIVGAAAAIAKAVNPNSGSSNPAKSASAPQPSSSSPLKTAAQMQDLRMKNLEQLRYLRMLLQDGILTDSEHEEQKDSVMRALRNLHETWNCPPKNVIIQSVITYAVKNSDIIQSYYVIQSCILAIHHSMAISQPNCGPTLSYTS